jgi:hypothetical protein
MKNYYFEYFLIDLLKSIKKESDDIPEILKDYKNKYKLYIDKSIKDETKFS